MVTGSIREISLSGRIFSVSADSDPSRKLGGFANEGQANGDGSMRVVQVRELWTVDGLTISMDDDRGDEEFLQNLADAGDLFVITVTYAGNITYQGSGQITGEITRASQAGTGDIALTGPGKFTKQ